VDVVSVCPDFCLNELPPGMWKALAAWFIEYPHNNLYHCQFFKLFQVIIHEEHVLSQEVLLKKHKFLSNVLTHFKTPESKDSRGFILMILNTMRFASDLQRSATGWLKQYVMSHDCWKSFVPELRQLTKEQMKRYTTELIEEEEAEFDEGIDLGSAYARSLGFDQDAPLPPTPEPPKKKGKKKKKSKSLRKLTEEGNAAESPQDSPASSPVISRERPDKEKEKEKEKAEKPKVSPIEVHLSKPEPEKKAEVPKVNESKETDMSWWKEMVTDFKKEEVAKTDNSWWDDLKQSLDSESNKAEDNSVENSWWADLKNELEGASK